MRGCLVMMRCAALLAALCARTARADLAFDPEPQPSITAAISAWQQASGNPAGWWIWGVTAWDQDGDGQPELILTTHQSSPRTGSRIVRRAQDADGQWGWQDVTESLGLSSSLLPHEYRPVAMDVDRDGRLDLLHATQGTAAIVLNHGDSLQLSAKTTYDLSSKAGHVTDANGDGWPDFVQLHRDYGKSSVQTFVNDQASGFVRTSVEQPIPAEAPEWLVEKLTAMQGDTAVQNRYCGPKWCRADLNGDGTEDVALQYAGSYANGNAGKPYRFGWYSVPVGVPDGTIPLDVRDVTGDGAAEVFAGYGPGGGVYSGGVLTANADLNRTLALQSPPYLTRLDWHDFDRDGDDDLLISTQRLGWLEIFDNRGSGQFVKILRAHHWDAEGWAVADLNGDGMLDVAIGGPGPAKPTSWPNQKNQDCTIYWNRVAPPVQPEPPVPPEPAEPEQPPPPPAPPAPASKLRHPLERADRSSPQAVRFLAWVDRALVRGEYGFSPFHAALAYRLTGNQLYALKAVQIVAGDVAAANAAIASGKAPAIAHDSYLKAFPVVQGIAYTLAWCRDSLTPDQIQAAEAYCRQAISNIWNPKGATWAGKPFPWSGWSVNNPGNNYHYSFLGATACWALYSGDEAALTVLERRLPALAAYLDALPGGGSREGTGYGVSHKALYELLLILRESGGTPGWSESLGVQHARDSLDYWIHATTPGGRYTVPIGDQARSSSAPVYDYHRQLVLEAIALCPDTPEAARGRWWLAACYPAMRDGFNVVYDLLADSGSAAAPEALSYAATGAGHYFARTDWGPDATLVACTVGPISESHAARDAGALHVWMRGGWLAGAQNARTKSGIVQDESAQTLLLFQRDGALLKQNRRASQAPVCFSDDGRLAILEADLSSVYSVPTGWRRRVVLDREAGTVRVTDELAPDAPAATWQLQAGQQPDACRCGREILLGRVARLTIREPVSPILSTESWPALDPANSLSGWRVSVSSTHHDAHRVFDVLIDQHN